MADILGRLPERGGPVPGLGEYLERAKDGYEVVVVGAGMLNGCVGAGGVGPSGAPPSPSGTRMTLSIQNGTTIAVTLVVKGKVIETVPAGGYENPIKNELPGLPWDVRELLEEHSRPNLPVLVLPAYQQAERVEKKAAEQGELFG